MGFGAALPGSLELFWKEPKEKGRVPKRYICLATRCSRASGAIIAIRKKGAFRKTALKISNRK